MPSQPHPILREVTARIRARSHDSRGAYLERIDKARKDGVRRGDLPCSNLAHAMAACPPGDKALMQGEVKVNLGIVTAYNDMLSAHQPYEDYPARIKAFAAEMGGVAQVAGGVPAMCDGITQGQTGMELSLFSRDVIAMATAIALSHNVFDAAACLGICDKIVPGLLSGALAFGHLPVVFIPSGPMASGLSNKDKAKARELYATGQIDRSELLKSELKSYHSPGTCTFYGTANSNQMLMEFMGLHLPGASFIHPDSKLRDALTRAAVQQVMASTSLSEAYKPIGHIIDEAAMVNAIVGLLATGGASNQSLHLIAIAAVAGIRITWDDFADLSQIIPLLARIYPNGPADVNHFQAAGGMGFVMRQLSRAGLLNNEVRTIIGPGLEAYAKEPYLNGGALSWRSAPEESLDQDVLRSLVEPFAPDGGLKVLSGNLGRAVIKTSAVLPEHRKITAPVRIFTNQDAVQQAFGKGELHRDFICVLRFHGPAANGMPELHKLVPLLGVLQDLGYKVALVTDGRMSGASGKIPAAIHVTPEALKGGALARLRDGDIVSLDAERGVLEAQVAEETWRARSAESVDLSENQWGMGRELFGNLRASVGGAERGATVLGPWV